MDSIKRAVFEYFCPDNKDWHFASKFVAQIIKKICDDNSQESDAKHPQYFIFDTPHLYPEDVSDFPKKDFIIVFLGYPNMSVERKTDIILRSDSQSCWTQKLPREELEKLVRGNIEFSKEILEQCNKYNLKFFDINQVMSTSIFKALKDPVDYIYLQNNDSGRL